MGKKQSRKLRSNWSGISRKDPFFVRALEAPPLVGSEGLQAEADEFMGEGFMVEEDLNRLVPRKCDSPEYVYFGGRAKSGSVEVLFRGLKERLIKEILQAPVVYGCVAWLTDFDILAALQKRGVSVLVQKEDFLRPDLAEGVGWKFRLRSHYLELGVLDRTQHPIEGIRELSSCGDPTLEAIRCVGNYNSDKKPAFPRMHNKFLVFCDKESNPLKVWTGSFNFTQNASYSFENAVIISDSVIATVYLQEFAHIMAFSEPLDWEAEWCHPQWRIGT